MQRREFITLLGGAAVPWPRAAARSRPTGCGASACLKSRAADDPEGQVRRAVFLQGLQELGWTDCRDVRIDQRWAAGDADRSPAYAAELISGSAHPN
jgi:putative tryptophan/tyrosine transport system substrate-binding protein